MTDNQTTQNNCNIERTKQCLSDLFKNVTMAGNCIQTLLPYVQEHSAHELLKGQMEQYHSYANDIVHLGKNINFMPTPVSKATICMANMGIKSKMLVDKSTTHVGKIMLQGTLNGIIDLYRLMRGYTDVHPDLMQKVVEVLRYQEGALEGLKSLL